MGRTRASADRAHLAKTAVDTAAAAVARDVTLVAPNVIRDIAARAVAVHREVRVQARAMSDEQLAASVAAEFRRRRLRSDDLVVELSRRRLVEG